MKNKSLIILIFASILIFAGLVFSVFKIVSKKETAFYASGYVSIADSENSEKIYFNRGTEYKKGYNEEITFKDKEDAKKKVSIYSFVFYDNKSINFLNNGVLMDLDSVNETFIPYYNIKSNYLIEFKNNAYEIASTENDIKLNNFIGRISDEKYIVAGNDLKLKLSTSEEYITDYYFELFFKDGNIVKIDSPSLNVETISDESYILVGDKIKVDLSNKAIFYEDEVKVNLSEIIVDNDKNIDILYEAPEVPEGGGSGSGEGSGDGTGEGGSGDSGSGGGSGSGTGSGSGDGQGDGEGTGEDGSGDGAGGGSGGSGDGDYEVETVIEYKKVPYVELLSSNVNSHKIALDFNVIDTNELITGPITVKILNMETSEINSTQYSNYSSAIEYIADSLTSNSRYMITISASYVRDGNIFSNFVMFQRTFVTSNIGVSLKKDYVSSSELAFVVEIDKNATFSSGVVKLYDDAGEVVGSTSFENNHQNVSVLFEGLNSNSFYVAKVEDIKYGNVVYTGGSASYLEGKTLKYNPFKDAQVVLAPVAKVNKKDNLFEFDLQAAKDMDKAILSVEYRVFDKETGEIVKTIKRSNTSPIEVAIDENIKKNTSYYFSALITLHDNEKEIDYVTLNSNDFNMDHKVSPTLKIDTEEVTANTFKAKALVTDSDNAIDTNQRIYLEYTNSIGEKLEQDLEMVNCPESESSTSKCFDIYLEELRSDDVYTISLMAYVDLNDPEVEAGFMQVGAIKVETQVADIILTNMTASTLGETEALEKVFEVNVNFELGPETAESIRDNMTGFDIQLYEGSSATGDFLGFMHVEENIVEDYFNNTKALTLSDFGLDLETLRNLHLLDGSSMSKDYTIKLTNGKSGSDYIEFRPNTFTFEISDVILKLLDNDATINVDVILNNKDNGKHDSLLEETTIIGLRVSPNFSSKSYVTNLNFEIIDVTDSSGNNLRITEKIELKENDIIPVFEYYFSDYPDFFKRGRVYQVKYTMDLDLNKDGSVDVVYPFMDDDMSTPSPVTSSNIDVPKQNPSMILFPWTSDSASITYKYSVTDVDNALPQNYDVFYETGENAIVGVKNACEANVSKYETKYSCVRLEGLNAGDIYNIYLNAYLLETADAEPTKIDINNYTFEGYHTSLNTVSFESIKNEDGVNKYNNLLVLEIKAPEGDLSVNRISKYSLVLTYENRIITIDNINDSTKTSPVSSNVITYIDSQNSQNNLTWNATMGIDNALQKTAYVSTCEGDVGVCIYLDYSKLYNSATFKQVFNALKNHEVSVTVGALYDTGKVGFLASAINNYAFQVVANEEIKAGDEIYNNKYYIVHSSNKSAATFSNYALSGIYGYSPSNGGFVDDSSEDNTQNYKVGKIYFINKSYNNMNYLTYDYEITKRGVEVPFASVGNLPIVAKELATTTISGSDFFKYERVIPSISVLNKVETLNGVKLNMMLSGITNEDILEEANVRYLYVDVLNEESNTIKTIKINKDELTVQSATFSGNTYKIKTYDNYKVDVISVSVNDSQVTNFAYDYKTGVITFNESYAPNSTILVNYRVIIDGLNVNSNYTLKAYMTVNGSKTYLADNTSKTYNDFVYEFKTLDSIDVTVSDVKLDVKSSSNYIERFLTLDYNIDEIVGIDNISYEICNSDKTICVDSNSYSPCAGEYNSFDGTCFIKNNAYSANATFDVSITDIFDLKYNTSYNVVISAQVTGLDENSQSLEIYNNGVYLRGLEDPTLSVVKKSKHAGGSNYYISFDLSFSDPDRIISKPKDNLENGEYIVYLTEGELRTKVENPKDINGKVLPSEQVIKVAPGGVDSVATITYGYLDPGSEYNLIVEYKTYSNNLGSASRKEYAVPYLIYTLDDNGISIGKVEYTPQTNLTILKFGFASNFVQDFIVDESGILVPDPNQEAYVAGIVYDISMFDDYSFALHGDLIFDESNKIEYVTSGGNSEIGESYYQITLPNTAYKVEKGLWYRITYQFYLGGNIAKNYTTESLCKGASISNYWNSKENECYVLGAIRYYNDAMYGGEQ